MYKLKSFSSCCLSEKEPPERSVVVVAVVPFHVFVVVCLLAFLFSDSVHLRMGFSEVPI